MIELAGLSFTYDGRTVFEDVSLAVDRGARLAIVGANGAGKTTLLRLVADLLEPDSGSVSVDGPVGFAPEDPQTGLFAATVTEEVAFFPRNRNMDVDPAVSTALEAMDLCHLANRKPFTLSVGEQRRVSIAAVLSGQPTVLALDEPTTGLDRRGARDLGGLLADIDATVVFSTHDTDFAFEVADRVAVLAGNELRRHGPTRAVLGDTELLERVGVRPPGLVQLAKREALERIPDDIDEAVAMLGAPS